MKSEERHLRVPRTARYRVLGDPAASGEVWFVVHGYKQLAERFIQRFASLPGLESGDRAVVAPEALNRFYVDDSGGEHGPESRVGATWMTRADREHEIQDYVEYLDRLASEVLTPGMRPVVLGFSQGAATASRWSVYGNVAPSRLILWGGGLAADLDMEQAGGSLRDVEIQLVTGSGDPWAKKRAAESRRRLKAAGLSPATVSYEGGHRVTPSVLVRAWPL